LCGRSACSQLVTHSSHDSSWADCCILVATEVPALWDKLSCESSGEVLQVHALLMSGLSYFLFGLWCLYQLSV